MILLEVQRSRVVLLLVGFNVDTYCLSVESRLNFPCVEGFPSWFYTFACGLRFKVNYMLLYLANNLILDLISSRQAKFLCMYFQNQLMANITIKRFNFLKDIPGENSWCRHCLDVKLTKYQYRKGNFCILVFPSFLVKEITAHKIYMPGSFRGCVNS